MQLVEHEDETTHKRGKRLASVIWVEGGRTLDDDRISCSYQACGRLEFAAYPILHAQLTSLLRTQHAISSGLTLRSHSQV